MAKHMRNGDPLIIKTLPYRAYIWCCDCNLCHLHIFDKGKNGEIIVTTYRDEYLTEKERNKGKKKKPKSKK